MSRAFAGERWSRKRLYADIDRMLRGAVPRPWAAQAACRGMDVTLFFPGQGDRLHPAVKLICASCPVQVECADYAIENEEHGTWAGMSERDRKQKRSQRRAARLGVPVYDVRCYG